MFKTQNVNVLLASAGAGKTTYLLNRIEEDLKVYRPQDLSFVSYTRKGAYEGRDRLVQQYKLDPEDFEYFRTLHSLTYNELGIDRKQLFDGHWVAKFNEVFGFKVSIHAGYGSSKDSKMLSLYDVRRSGKKDLYEDTGIPGFNILEYNRFVTAYEKFKEAHGLFDFTDCLEEFVKRGKPVPVKVAYIDEAQDLTKLQWQVCFTAFSQAEKIYLAGDDFQSIYTYAGAKPEFLIQFANKFPTIKLEVSYRLPQKVYKLSRAITELIGMKVEKDYVPFKDDEGVVELVNDRNLIARKVASKPDESWLILFRNNYHIPLFEKELQANLVLYHNSGGFCIGQNILSKIKKYLNFRKKGYSDPITAERFKKDYNITSFDNDIIDCALIESDKRYMAQSYLDKYGFELLEKTAIAKPKILVSTVHKVKGAEATNVVFFADCTKKVIENKSKDFDAELRVLYVAVTRAKKRLYLVRSQSNQGLDDILDVVMEEAEL